MAAPLVLPETDDGITEMSDAQALDPAHPQSGGAPRPDAAGACGAVRVQRVDDLIVVVFGTREILARPERRQRGLGEDAAHSVLGV